MDLPPGTPSSSTYYDLLANITHESTAGTTRDKANTAWKVTLRAPPAVSSAATSGQPEAQEDESGEDQWISIQDLIVEKVQKEIIFLGETVLQIWERRDEKEKREGRARAAAAAAGSPSKRDKMDVDG